MALSVGTRLGPYEILAPIGAGGMGEVYRARDTKLKRDVALKVLPDSFAADPERLARFQREAEVLAALNHTNIAAIYGIENRALVMELVQGETLKGPLPLETSLDYARQIADALEAAHEKGIVHRDLKPGNIMITSAGVVKVLDFGLAKAAEGRAGDPQNSPTETISPTRIGVILGTVAYMSPEQVRGKAVDKRADIWAFGAVLYEMLTGRQAFRGETTSDILAAVIKEEPTLDALSANLRPVIERCLRKDPRKRWRDIGDVRMALEEQPAPVADAGRSGRGWFWMTATIAMAAIATLASWVAWRFTRPVERPLMRLSVDLGPDVVVNAGFVISISPDGSRLAFLTRGADGKTRLATRFLAENQVTLLPGTEGAESAFFSPDSKWIGFLSDGKMRKIPAQGGAAVTLCDVELEFGASWSQDGNIVAALNGNGGLYKISENGGMPQPLTNLGNDEVTHRWPQVLPGEGSVLFTSSKSGIQFIDAQIEALSFKTGQRKILVRGGYFGRYLPTNPSTGHLVYLHEGALLAVPFDPARLEVRGAAVPVLEDVSGSPAAGAGHFVFSKTGVFVYAKGTGAGLSWPLLWLDSSGKTEPLLPKPGRYSTPRFSPDGESLALAVRSNNGQDLYVYDWKRDTMLRLTFDGHTDGFPAWTPDGKHLVYSHADGARYSIQWTRSDGAGEAQSLLRSNGVLRPSSFSPDGRRLAYYEGNSETLADIWTVPLDLSEPEHPKTGVTKPFLRTPALEISPVFSPDGRWMAYASGGVNNTEVFVRPFPEPARQWQISSSGGKNPMWSRSSPELFFENNANQIMVADYTTTGDSFLPGKPRVWSPQTVFQPVGGINLDLAPDGKRFVIFQSPIAVRREGTQHVTFLLNFFDELRRRVLPGGK